MTATKESLAEAARIKSSLPIRRVWIVRESEKQFVIASNGAHGKQVRTSTASAEVYSPIDEIKPEGAKKRASAPTTCS